MSKEKLSGCDIVLVTLSPVTENCDLAICDDLRGQVTNLYLENRESGIIKDNFHIYLCGLHPISEDLEDRFNILLQGSCLDLILANNKYLVRPSKLVENIKNSGLISNLDYTFLRDLGKRIEVEHRYKEIKNL